VAAAGAERTFRVVSEDARWLVLTRVTSLERFLDWGRAAPEVLATPLSWSPTGEDFAAIASIAAANGIELLGPPGVLPGGRQQ
ncbi:MAG: hypothetical protein QOC55_433, partial [Thermoleophilaceae bacterium]|nr:hypothetical protein [Thermoleophilaceae bacterium]